MSAAAAVLSVSLFLLVGHVERRALAVVKMIFRGEEKEEEEKQRKCFAVWMKIGESLTCRTLFQYFD